MTDYTSAEFWAAAPEGATHYSPVNDMFYIFKGISSGKYWSKSREGWLIAGCIGEYSHMIPRPTTQPAAWNGPEDGFPPAGTVCEFQNGMGGWSEVEITAIAKHGICFVQHGRDGENYVAMTAKFRPIRTPEQIAAAEREAYIKRMRECVNDFERDRDDDFGRLYDAGLRFKDDSK